jgi:hypothetical protein
VEQLSEPAYGAASLADVAPSLCAALGGEGFENVLDLPPTRAACLLLVDGLGWRLLEEHAEHAPVLSSLSARAITAGFPTTTATSIASLGTGSPGGVHGITGYGFRVGDVLLNPLTWRADDADARETLPPDQVQPRPTVFERAVAAGIGAHQVVPRLFKGSGLTKAAMRGARLWPTLAVGDIAAHAGEASRAAGPQFVYAYHADLDMLGHVYGPGTPAWCHQLRTVDALAASLLAELPDDAKLIVVADHGMVAMDFDLAVVFEDEPALRHDVAALGGDVRARHVYLEPGADIVAAQRRWRDRLGDGYLVVSREEVVERGWYGPAVDPAMLPRIGDFMVLATGLGGVRRSEGPDAMISNLPGQHGSLTEAEQLVPLLVS